MNELVAPVSAPELQSKAYETRPCLPTKQSETDEPESASTAMPRWRMALLVLSSACMSGVAIVVWNRRSLQRMRQTAQAVPENEDSQKAETWSEFI